MVLNNTECKYSTTSASDLTDNGVKVKVMMHDFTNSGKLEQKVPAIDVKIWNIQADTYSSKFSQIQ